jgi:putative tryptophan/tyrosine transport system substrate-binding protein
MRRRQFISLIGAAAAWPLGAHAQQVGGVRRIGVLMPYPETTQEAQGWVTVFRAALSSLGWVEGQNIHFELRWTGPDADRMRQAVQDLVALQPDLIIPGGSPTTALFLQQTHTIPIVFVNIVDPVGQGFVASLSRPGGNATGLVNLEPSMVGKWIDLLKELAPSLARVVVAFQPATAPYAESYLKYFKSSAQSVAIEIIAQSVPDMAALEAVAATQAREPNIGFALMPSAFVSGHTVEIAALMAQYRLPAIYAARSFAEAGGLISYGNDISENYRQAATFVDKILKGAKPSELPVQFPTKFELIINKKTAQSFGLTVPLTLQAAADEVIE